MLTYKFKEDLSLRPCNIDDCVYHRMGSSVGYYTGSSMPAGGVYQGMGGMQGMSGGMYGTPQGPTAAGHTATVSYRAPTPPQTPSTQASQAEALSEVVQ